MTKIVNIKNGLIPASQISLNGGGDVLSNLVEYSAQEKVIGKWIDGKPVYRKCFTGVFGQNGYNHGITSLRNIIRIYGTYQNGSFIESDGSNAVFPTPCPRISYPDRYCDVFLRSDKFYFEIGNALSNTYHFILILEYTKN